MENVKNKSSVDPWKNDGLSHLSKERILKIKLIMDGFKSYLAFIPNEIGIKIASYLDLHSLFELRLTCKTLFTKSPFWVPNIFIQVQNLMEISRHLPKILEFKCTLDVNKPIICIKVKDYGTLCIRIQSDHSFQVKTLFRKVISHENALKDILESDPHSFHIYHPVLDTPFSDYSIGSFASSLRNYLKSNEQSTLLSMGLFTKKEEETNEYAPYKHALYPLDRSHPFVQNHILYLLQQGYILRTLVDGTVGVSCQDLLQEFEPPHWQDYMLIRKDILLTGKELPIAFMDISSLLDYIKMIQSRWKELYTPFISF